MAVSKWAKKLGGMKSSWKNSEESYKETFGASDIPEDTYIAQLQEAKLDEAKDGKVIIKREHVITEGEHKGVVVRDRMNLESDMGLVFMRRWLQMLGVDIPDDPAELETLVAEIKKAAPVCKVRVRHSGDFTNLDVISVEGEGEDSGAGDATGSDDVDLDAMDKAELRALVVANDLEIPGYRKMSEDELRAAISAMVSGPSEAEKVPDGESAEAEIDLDSMDKDEMLKLIKDNELKPKDLGFANALKMKAAKEDALRAALTAYLGGDAGGESGTGEVDELLEAMKVFCGTWDVAIADDADLDDIKTALKKCRFPEEELDETEKGLLEKIGMTDLIQKKTVAGKKKLTLKK